MRHFAAALGLVFADSRVILDPPMRYSDGRTLGPSDHDGLLADLALFWYTVRPMKKKAKPSTAKKQAAKPAAKKSAKPRAKASAKPAGKRSSASSGGTYTPQPIQGIGWAPFRYPLQ